jgi:hypothetical protein
LVAKWAATHDCRLVYALAGGYTYGITVAELVGLHRLTIDAFA